VAPIGAWIAVRASLDFPPLVLAIAVVCWVAGFDLIYATQDHEFDRREGLKSLVVRLGVSKSLKLAQALHLITLVGLIGFGFVAKLGPFYYGAMPLIVATLIYEHRSARRLDLAGINRAFFQSNAFVSAVFLLAICLDRLG
jgi:4-hydroxybenzoate polyprenyltransferase